MNHLFQAECSMSSCDSLPLRVAEWIKHAVVWMNGRQSILVQLILDDTHQFFHPDFIVSPITDDLKYHVEFERNLNWIDTVDSFKITKLRFFFSIIYTRCKQRYIFICLYQDESRKSIMEINTQQGNVGCLPEDNEPDCSKHLGSLVSTWVQFDMKRWLPGCFQSPCEWKRGCCARRRNPGWSGWHEHSTASQSARPASPSECCPCSSRRPQTSGICGLPPCNASTPRAACLVVEAHWPGLNGQLQTRDISEKIKTRYDGL